VENVDKKSDFANIKMDLMNDKNTLGKLGVFLMRLVRKKYRITQL